jgi:hypothetical protein
MAANTQTSVKKRGRGKPFTEGNDPRRNVAGRPPLGMSWREIFDRAGKLTKRELLDLYPLYGKRLIGLPDDVPLRDAVALSAMVTLACEPSPGLLATIIERVDGKVAQPIAFETMTDEQKREYVRDLLAAGGYILSGPEETGLQDKAAGDGNQTDV